MIAEHQFTEHAPRGTREIEGEIDEARRHLDETIDELSDRLDPRVLFAEVGRETKDKIATLTREHPIPAALMAASLIWMGTRACMGATEGGEGTGKRLAASAKKNRVPLALASTSLILLGGRAYARTPKGRQQLDDLKENIHSLAGQVEEKAEQFGHQVSEKTHQLRETVVHQTEKLAHKAGELSHEVSERTHHMRENVAQKAEQLGHGVSERSHELRENIAHRVDGLKEIHPGEMLSKASDRAKEMGAEVAHRMVEAKDTVQQSLRETGRTAVQKVKEKAHKLDERFEFGTQNHPLITSLGFLALGIAAAIALPRTKPENRAMGPGAKDMKKRLLAQGERLFEKGKEAVEAVVSEVAQEANQEEPKQPVPAQETVVS